MEGSLNGWRLALVVSLCVMLVIGFIGLIMSPGKSGFSNSNVSFNPMVKYHTVRTSTN